MKYRLKGVLDFKEVPQLNPLVTRALRAANRREQYREVVEVTNPATNSPVTIYVAVVYNMDTGEPVGLQVGKDFGAPFDESTMAELRAEGMDIVLIRPISTAPLVKRRRSFTEWRQDICLRRW